MGIRWTREHTDVDDPKRRELEALRSKITRENRTGIWVTVGICVVAYFLIKGPYSLIPPVVFAGAYSVFYRVSTRRLLQRINELKTLSDEDVKRLFNG